MKKLAGLLVCFLFTFAATAQPAGTVVQGEAGVANAHVQVNLEELARHAATNAAPGRSRMPRHMHSHSRTNATTTSTASASANTVSNADDTQITLPSVPSPAPGANFLALTDNGFFVPPDTMGAVGPSNLMVTANSQVRIQTRSGNALSTVSLNQFWAPVGGAPDTFDPKLTYDPYNGRWIFAAGADGELSTSAILIGVSATSDPTGNWFMYSVDADANNLVWADYPCLGFNKDFIVVTVNMYTLQDDSFDHTEVFAFNKTNLYANGTGLFTRFQELQGSTLQPAVTYDNLLSVEYLVEDFNGFAGQLRISRITGTPTAPVFTSGSATVNTGSTWYDGDVGNFLPQLGTSQRIEGNDARVLNCIFRNNSLWGAQSAFLPANFPTRSVAQWWQISTNGAVQQFGRVDDPFGVNFYAFPTLAVNRNNDVLIGYTRASASQYASANYSFRYGTDAANTMRDDTVYKTGEGCYVKTFGSGQNRWGDYSSTVVDPVDDLSMWTIQEYAGTPNGGCFDGSGRWALWWARVDVTLSSAVTVTTALTAENYTPTNSFIDPGETVSLRVTLRNTGQVGLTNVNVLLLANGSTVAPSPQKSYGTMPVGSAAVNNTFSYIAAGRCGGAVTNVFLIQVGGTNLATNTVVFPLGGLVSRLNQNFDSLKPPALPANWTSEVNGNTAWMTSSNAFFSASNSVFVMNPDSISEAILTSPSFFISSTNARLTFAHRYNTEYGFDGGVLEISLNNRDYVDILNAGGTFQVNGYNFFIDSGFGSPIAGRSAWTGENGTNFVSTIVNLPPSAAEHTARLRWRFASDNGVGIEGWYIDSVVVTDYTCGRPPPPVILNVRRQGNQTIFSYNSRVGLTYLIEYKDKITDPWTPLSAQSGTGALMSLTNSIGVTQRFYQLHEL